MSVRPVRIIALLCALLFAAPAVRAQCPDIRIHGNRINLGGYNAGTAGDQNDHCSPGTVLTVLVTNCGTPIPNLQVVLDFSGCTSDLRLATTQSFLGETANCTYSYVQTRTGSDGVATFCVRGTRVPGAPHARSQVSVYADSYLAGYISAGTYDQDGAGGVTLADLGLWAADYFGQQNPDRSDYDGNGYVGLSDLAAFQTCYLSNCSRDSGPSFCP